MVVTRIEAGGFSILSVARSDTLPRSSDSVRRSACDMSNLPPTRTPSNPVDILLTLRESDQYGSSTRQAKKKLEIRKFGVQYDAVRTDPGLALQLSKGISPTDIRYATDGHCFLIRLLMEQDSKRCAG